MAIKAFMDIPFRSNISFSKVGCLRYAEGFDQRSHDCLERSVIQTLVRHTSISFTNSFT